MAFLSSSANMMTLQSEAAARGHLDAAIYRGSPRLLTEMYSMVSMLATFSAILESACVESAGQRI